LWYTSLFRAVYFAVILTRNRERNRDSILEIQKILEEKVVPALKLRARSSAELRRAYPKMRVASSIFEKSKDDAASIFSFEHVPTATQFDFDRDLANSPVYRRTLSAHEDNIKALRKETAKLVSALNDHTAQDVPVLRAQLEAYEEANKKLQGEISQRMNEREKILERMGKLQESMRALEAQTKAQIQVTQKEMTALQTKNRLLKIELGWTDADEEDIVKNFNKLMSFVLEELKESGASKALQEEFRRIVEMRANEARFYKEQKEHLSSWDGKTRILPIWEERSPWDFDSDI
jgi:septal ring factor EnvC (AmiA/AmiB activator)